jgi:hypothetical protein
LGDVGGLDSTLFLIGAILVGNISQFMADGYVVSHLYN